VDPKIKHDRSEKLIKMSSKNFAKFASRFIGKELEVLFEKNVKDDVYEGLTTNYIRVYAKSDTDIQGLVKKVKIIDVKDNFIEGSLV